MQAMQGQPLWPYEESSLQRPHLSSAAALQFLVQSLVREESCLYVLLYERLCKYCHVLSCRVLQWHLIGTTGVQVDVLGFEADIRGRWAAEAMRWMLQSSSRHLTARSHQVFSRCSLFPFADRRC